MQDAVIGRRTQSAGKMAANDRFGKVREASGSSLRAKRQVKKYPLPFSAGKTCQSSRWTPFSAIPLLHRHWHNPAAP
ncbi:MAG: hypothetical protein RR842_13765 [Gordonibacter sp.]|uniref:hypothetical protein n=1 Tax=Gordonibacter sp. TaxID=1968902 RepID=UPI002FCC7C70